jgi:diguanylate cyclase (GGDEF)-like protein
MNNQNKATFFQWIVPSAVLMLIVAIMLSHFFTKSSSNAADQVSKDLIKATQEYGETFMETLKNQKRISQPVRKVLERDGVQNQSLLVEMLEVLASSSDAYEVYYCDENGRGVNQEGESISVADTAYFETIQNSPGTDYVYTEEADKKSIVVVDSLTTVSESGYLLMYYPMEKFAALMGQKDIDGSAFLALVDEDGDVLGLSDAGAGALQEDNLLDAISNSDATAVRTISNRMKNGARGSTDVLVSGQSYLLVYMPVGTNDWEMFLGVSRTYADTQIALQWKDTKNVLLSLLVVIFVFICLVVVINIISKLRGKEKEKQLENKADTDLLTGLNNKLATERKIKEYMAHNPETQSMLFILDVDNFKKINDTMGHAFGDEVLRSLGQQIGVIFRTSDIIGRVGGDEFMIFLKGITDDSAVRKEAKKVEAFFKSFQAGEYVKYAATASIGVAIYPQEGSDFETLYKAADQGLYKAKKRGKNQLAFYRDEWAQEPGAAKAE